MSAIVGSTVVGGRLCLVGQSLPVMYGDVWGCMGLLTEVQGAKSVS